MIANKERITVTVDAFVVEEGNRAVEDGRADSLSAWVNAALGEHIAKERRFAAMSDAISAYEKRFGSISDEELAAQQRNDRRAAIVVRGRNASGRSKTGRGKS